MVHQVPSLGVSQKRSELEKAMWHCQTHEGLTELWEQVKSPRQKGEDMMRHRRVE